MNTQGSLGWTVASETPAHFDSVGSVNLSVKDRALTKADLANTGHKGTADSSRDRISTQHVLARAKKSSVCLGLALGSLPSMLPYCLHVSREL